MIKNNEWLNKYLDEWLAEVEKKEKVFLIDLFSDQSQIRLELERQKSKILTLKMLLNNDLDY